MSQWTISHAGNDSRLTPEDSASTRTAGAASAALAQPQLVDLQRHEGQVGRVRGPVAELAGAELPPEMPLHPVAVVGPVGGRAQPQVPVQARGTGCSPWAAPAVGPAAAVPDVDFLDLAQRAVADQFQRPAERAAVGALVAHRRGDLVLAGQLAQGPRLVDRAGQRLFAEDVLAGLDGRGRDDRMGVVGRGDDHRVDLLHLVEHLAEVVERLGLSLRPGAGTRRPARRSQSCSEAATSCRTPPSAGTPRRSSRRSRRRRPRRSPSAGSCRRTTRRARRRRPGRR